MSNIGLGDFFEFDVFCECAVVNRTNSSLFAIGGFKSAAWPQNETADFNQRAVQGTAVKTAVINRPPMVSGLDDQDSAVSNRWLGRRFNRRMKNELSAKIRRFQNGGLAAEFITAE